MDEVKQKLIGCFQIVFPELSEAEIPQLSQATAAAWDSVAAITLLNVLEDEFGIEMDLDQVAELDSFEKIYTYLQQRLQAA
jgi:acyl carrier protein